MILSSHVSSAGPQTTGDASPARIPGLVAWYDARYLNLADGDPVGTYPDLSGNGFDLTQGTTAAKPTFVASGYDGTPAIFLDGVDDYLTKSGIVGTDLDSDEMTIICETARFDTALGFGIWFYRTPAEAPWTVWQISTRDANYASEGLLRGATTSGLIRSPSVFTAQTFSTSALRFKSTPTASGKFNARGIEIPISISEPLYDSVGNNDQIRIGNNSSTGHGQIKRAIAYKRQLTDAELSYLGVQMP